MKSIGIITYHHYINYGTMLQAYALQHYIASLGYKAELIDFLLDRSMSKLDLIKLRIRRLPAYISQCKKYAAIAAAKQKNAEKAKLFEEFYKKNLVVSKKHYSKSQQLVDDPPLYDGYVVGSDQTWNPYAAGGQDVFFLPFVEDNTKKGSYAPSISVSSLTQEQEERIKRHLHNFSYLSCRELQGTELLKKILKKDVKCVIDPTLLLSDIEWIKVASKINIEKPYILVYFLGDVEKQRDFVKKLADRTGYMVVTIPASYLEFKNKSWNQQWCGPDGFISLFNNAAYVCTDSFHGTAFAINFNKPFFTFCKTKDNERISENSRLYSILDMFGLSGRLIEDGKLPKDLSVDFSYANKVLNQKRHEATVYLEKMLKTITR